MKENEIAGLAKAFEQKLIQGPKNPVPEFILEEIRDRKEPEIEMRFSVGDRYSKKLFIALARKRVSSLIVIHGKNTRRLS